MNKIYFDCLYLKVAKGYILIDILIDILNKLFYDTIKGNYSDAFLHSF